MMPASFLLSFFHLERQYFDGDGAIMVIKYRKMHGRDCFYCLVKMIQ